MFVFPFIFLSSELTISVCLFAIFKLFFFYIGKFCRKLFKTNNKYIDMCSNELFYVRMNCSFNVAKNYFENSLQATDKRPK